MYQKIHLIKTQHWYVQLQSALMDQKRDEKWGSKMLFSFSETYNLVKRSKKTGPHDNQCLRGVNCPAALQHFKLEKID
jgi:hypothetical protein